MIALVAWPRAAMLITCDPFRRVLRSDNLRPAALGRAHLELLAAFSLAPAPEGGA